MFQSYFCHFTGSNLSDTEVPQRFVVQERGRMFSQRFTQKSWSGPPWSDQQNVISFLQVPEVFDVLIGVVSQQLFGFFDVVVKVGYSCPVTFNQPEIFMNIWIKFSYWMSCSVTMISGSASDTTIWLKTFHQERARHSVMAVKVILMRKRCLSMSKFFSRIICRRFPQWYWPLMAISWGNRHASCLQVSPYGPTGGASMSDVGAVLYTWGS